MYRRNVLFIRVIKKGIFQSPTTNVTAIIQEALDRWRHYFVDKCLKTCTRRRKVETGEKTVRETVERSTSRHQGTKKSLEYHDGVALRQATKAAKSDNAFKARNPDGTYKNLYRHAIALT